MTVFREIEGDLDWREAELAILRLLLLNDDTSDREKLVLFRAAWALLYAHYEGFCKFALTVYFEEVQRSEKLVADLPGGMKAASLEKKLKLFRALPSADLIEQASSFAELYLSRPPEFAEVDTKSNLWPDTLRELLVAADLQLETLAQHNRAISTLVGRRNKIAHGERDMIPEYDYYIGFENAVKMIMYDLALSIDEKLRAIC